MSVFDLNPINVLLAMIFGAGVFALVMSLGYRPDVRLREIEKVYGGGQAQLSPLGKLQLELDRARFHISATEFLLVSAGLAVLGGLGGYLLTGLWLAGVFGVGLGGVSYWLYLSNKAGKNMQAYEDELPQVVARLINGAEQGGDLARSAEHVAQFGPLLCRDDWQEIADQMRLRKPTDEIFQTISERRQSTLLDLILELLLLQQQTKTPLTDVLPMVQESLTERVRAVQKARTKMKEPINELKLVSAAPFVAVILFRFVSPQFAAGFSTPIGQLLVLAGWGVTVTAFVVAYRSFEAALRRETSFSAPLKTSKSRQRLKPRDTPATPDADQGEPGRAPEALQSITGE